MPCASLSTISITMSYNMRCSLFKVRGSARVLASALAGSRPFPLCSITKSSAAYLGKKMISMVFPLTFKNCTFLSTSQKLSNTNSRAYPLFVFVPLKFIPSLGPISVITELTDFLIIVVTITIFLQLFLDLVLPIFIINIRIKSAHYINQATLAIDQRLFLYATYKNALCTLINVYVSKSHSRRITPLTPLWNV